MSIKRIARDHRVAPERVGDSKPSLPPHQSGGFGIADVLVPAESRAPTT